MGQYIKGEPTPIKVAKVKFGSTWEKFIEKASK